MLNLLAKMYTLGHTVITCRIKIFVLRVDRAKFTARAYCCRSRKQDKMDLIIKFSDVMRYTFLFLNTVC